MKNKVKVILAKYYYTILSLMIFLLGKLNGSKYNRNSANQIPIIINNRNRLEYLLQLLKFLEESNCLNIIILDNDSTYEPLMSYYKTCPYRVVRLNKNMGYMALQNCELWPEIRKDYFVYTDPDVVPSNDCPNDFMQVFFDALISNRLCMKVGFSLKIDDLPDYYKQKNQVIEWESQFYESKLNSAFYNAKIDTTFALHRPWSNIGHKGLYKHLRSAYPYEAKHLPWYEDSLNPTIENSFYKDHAEIGGFWTNGWKNKLLRFDKN
jgi:hypothetical protein